MQEQPRPSRDPILLIDDDQFIAGSLKQYLVANEWDVDVAGDRSAAEELMRARQYGVVLVDPYLTRTLDEDRETLLSSARQLQPDAALIVLTAYGSPDMERAANDCHAIALLGKPQSVVSLTEMIDAASQRRIPIKR